MKQKVLDLVWMIVMTGDLGVIYAIGTSRSEAWDQAIRVYFGRPDLDGGYKIILIKRGYKCKRVRLVLA